MKKFVITLFVALMTIGCNSQESNKKELKKKEKIGMEEPEGNWEVNKEFDEEGNMIRYDSIYSWSSGNDLDELATFNRDSTLKSLQSRFYRNFSQFDFDKEGYGKLFTEDSLFTKRFFNNDFFENDFGRDFMNLDQMHERMMAVQRQFLERYQPLVRPESKKDSLRQ